jgi:glycogen synthase
VKIKKLIVTGNQFFLQRHRFLYDAIAEKTESLQCMPCGDISSFRAINFLAKMAYAIGSRVSRTTAHRLLQTNPKLFIARSRNSQKKLRALKEMPDLILHIFGMFGPCWDDRLPYVMYLDYTMALAYRNYREWAPFVNREELERWLDCERHVYSNALMLFPMSELVKRSLIEDYGISADRIQVVGSSGNFLKPYEGPKSFGTRQILFNGTDFLRKGGELAIQAFRTVRDARPEAKLIILGNGSYPKLPGVQAAGFISSRDELERLFLQSDLVVAPAYCDPFPGFLIEAMNYGVPCIVSSRDGMPEIVDHNRTGIVLQNLNSQALAEAISELVDDQVKLQSMSKAAREKVQTKLNWKHIGGAVAQYLAKL